MEPEISVNTGTSIFFIKTNNPKNMIKQVYSSNKSFFSWPHHMDVECVCLVCVFSRFHECYYYA